MAERLIFVAEVIVVLRDFYLIAAMVYTHPWQTCVCVRSPRIERILLILAAADFAQVLYSVVALVAVNVVNLLLWPTVVTDRPDGMVQTNINLSLAQTA